MSPSTKNAKKRNQSCEYVEAPARTTIGKQREFQEAVLGWHRTVQEQGYGLIPAVFTKDEVFDLLKQISGEALQRTRAGVRHAMRSNSVAQIARDARMMEFARHILGERAIAFRATLFEKLPDSNWLVGWHQDTALPLRNRREVSGWGPWSLKDNVNYAHAPADELEKIVAFRVHLDDSTLENGPLRVLPGTHTQGVLTDDEIHVIAGRMTSIDCLMALGGVMAMRPLVIHGSSKSRTEKPRRVLHIEYAESAEMANGLELAIA
jgi:ectoine hydroxylase-related dioxygenase (phytanoyl-CoA dioxygenase family)